MAQLANLEFRELGFDMNSLPDQVMPHFLDGKDKSKTFLFDQVVATFCANQGFTEIIDGLLGTFIILLCEQST